MKKKYVCVVCIITTLLLVGCFKEEFTTSFFDSIIQGDFENASNHVALYETYGDALSDDAFKAAKAIWVNRLEELRKNGIYIESYTITKLTLDDGYLIGYVDLNIKTGYQAETMKIDAVINYSKIEDEWKINMVYFETANLNAVKLREALSGYIGEPR